jgi:hypothetical protein
MKLLHTIIMTSLLAVGVATPATSQENYSDLYVFGYMQAAYVDIGQSILGPHSTTFFLQQANIMASKEFDAQFSSFLNLQLTNSYNSQLGWGAMNLEEGWVKYSYSRAFNVKGGLILPSFNALLKVKNRTPLLPYILRPLVYEPLMADRMNTEVFLPFRANAEVYGSIPVYGIDLDYAVFWGNSESSYIISGHGTGFQVSGMDTTLSKLWGGRLGVSTPWMRVGVSATTDKENQTQMGLGAVQRYRLGADMSVHFSHLSFDGEVILVRTDLDDRQTGMFSMIRAFNPMIGTALERNFLYGTLLWDFNDALYVYGSYSVFQVNDYVGMDDGVRSLSFGGGWRPVESVVVKAQYVKISSDSPAFPLNIGIPIIAVSVMF